MRCNRWLIILKILGKNTEKLSLEVYFYCKHWWHCFCNQTHTMTNLPWPKLLQILRKYICPLTCFIFLFKAATSAALAKDISSPGDMAYTKLTSSAAAASIKSLIFSTKTLTTKNQPSKFTLNLKKKMNCWDRAKQLHLPQQNEF